MPAYADFTMSNTFEVYEEIAIDESTDEELCNGEKTPASHPRTYPHVALK